MRLGQSLGQASNGSVSVSYSTRDLSATAGQDFTAKSGTLSFAPGESVKTVVVDLLDDSVAEALERFELVLSNPINAALGDGVALGQIALNDGAGSAQPRISVSDVTVGEADRYVDIPVLLHAPSTNPITVDYTYDTPTAAGNDFVAFGGTLNFAPGETAKTVRVQLRDDSTAEGPETFYFGLRDASNAAISRAWAGVNIVDNDTIVETPQLFVEDLMLDEKQGTASFVVRLGQSLGQASNGSVNVNYTTRDGTAIAGQDFVAKSGTLSFAPGESVKTVVVDLLDDTLPEPLERFSFVLSSPLNAALADGVAAGEIALSDGAGSSQPRISVNDVTVSEADRYVDIPVLLHAPSSNSITVSYTYDTPTAGGNDFVAFGGTLNFAPGETAKSVRVQLRDDITVEATEVFSFLLRSPTNATVSRGTAQVTILDDDDGSGRPLLSQGRSNDVYVIDTSAVDFIEAADGGFDVVRSSTSFTLPAVLEGVILSGTALNATGNDAANFFMGNASNNTIDGRGGIDTAALAGRDVDYTITGNSISRSVSRPGEGSDTLLSIERLQFVNIVQAFDSSPGGNTWGAFALLNAAFDAHPSPALLGQWTSQLDQLGSLNELARAMIQYYAPGVSNEVLVAHLWSTVVEIPLTPSDLASFVGLIENGTFTQASLTAFAATHAFNTDEFAQLVGQPMLMDPAWFPLPGA